MKVNAIVVGDCIEELKKIPADSVDLIFADPPYNMQLKNALYRPNNTMVDGVRDAWDKFPSFSQYDSFCAAWLAECRRALKDTGSIWVIGSYHNIFRVGRIMLDLGFWILNDVTWHKTNPMPNFLGARFTNATETLLWCSKGELCKKYTFNHKIMKRYNGDKQMTSVWQIGLCTGGERLKGKDGKKAHSAQKPEELLKRVILSSSNEGDVVLDPFFGTGTTGAVAKKLRRNFIGIEKEAEYAELAKKRIEAASFFFPEADWKEEAKLVKVTFETLLRERLIEVGEPLHSKKSLNAVALVLPDGKIEYKDRIGSIHGIGALVQKTHACNGWKFWHVMRGGKPVLIDELRKGYGEAAI
ncbi:MAG: site-specific DNA-methyltransferase [Treponema sp.]|nr:site-specific DNA-methyltransferase [Treponema sp.]